MLAECGKRQVGQIVSAERGELITFVGIVNALGTALPPVFVFPRMRYKDSFINGAPTGSLGLASRNGWMVAQLFTDVLKHICKHTQCTIENPILLLIDNHVSHISIESISFAKENGIVVLSFPPHCSHRLQPLDVSVYNPFKSCLKVAMNNHMISNPAKPITIYELPAICRIAFNQAFSMNNIQSGFAKSGIWPLNEFVFTEADYAASYVTDRPDPNQVASENVAANEIPETPADYLAGGESSTTENVAASENKDYQQLMTPEMVRPFPKAAARKKTSNRPKIKSTIYTDTPVKQMREKKEAEKNKPKTKAAKPAKVVPV